MSSDKKLRIIHTEASPHWGGQEIRIFEEMKWFREQGHEMILVAPNNGTLYQRCKDQGFEVISIYFTKPRTILNILKMLWLIRRKKPDVVATHSSTDSWAGLTTATILGIKKRVRYRHVSAPVKKNMLNRWQYKFLANFIFTTGECIRKPLIEDFNLDQEKIYVMPTPVTPPSNLLTKEEAIRNLQKELNVNEQARFIGQVSVLRGWKGHKFLLDAFQQIADKHLNIHLVLVGEGTMKECLLDKRKSMRCGNRIHFTGHKENVYDYFRAFECSILASTHNEGIPQSLLQAMYAESPVVGTDVGGIPEIVINNVTGILVDPMNAKSLANGVFFVLDEPASCNNYIYAIKHRIKNKFKWKFTGNLMVNIYK